MTLEEIEAVIEKHRERVRQIEGRGLKQIRNSSWGRVKAKEHYSEKFCNEDCKFDKKIEALDYKQKYFNGYSFDNYLDRVIKGIE